MCPSETNKKSTEQFALQKLNAETNFSLLSTYMFFLSSPPAAVGPKVKIGQSSSDTNHIQKGALCVLVFVYVS